VHKQIEACFSWGSPDFRDVYGWTVSEGAQPVGEPSQLDLEQLLQGFQKRDQVVFFLVAELAAEFVAGVAVAG
jgi:hypothetical protein